MYVCMYVGLCTCFDSNGDEYGSSDGYGRAGSRGDCGYAYLYEHNYAAVLRVYVCRWVVKPTLSIVSTCPGSTPCSGHGFCNIKVPHTFIYVSIHTYSILVINLKCRKPCISVPRSIQTYMHTYIYIFMHMLRASRASAPRVGLEEIARR
jgi:hypothetical protein